MKRTIFVLCSFLAVQISFGIDPSCVGHTTFREFDGFCNNVDHPTWANAFIGERRVGPAHYQDGLSIPYDGPNARQISQTFFALPPQIYDINKTLSQRVYGPKPDDRALNQFAVTTMQFLTHDMAFTPLVFIPGDPNDFGVEILNCTNATSRVYDELCIWPYPGDPHASPPQTVLFTRPSISVTDSMGRFTPFTNVSGFIDLSNVYGSDNITSAALRSFSDGKLKVGTMGEPLPRAIDIGVGNDCLPFVTDGFGAGDIRVDENMGITTLHVAFLRNHNWLCDQLIASGLTGEEAIFQKARDLNIGTWQHIVYDELIPFVAGDIFMARYLPDYPGYDNTVDPSIQIEVTTAGFRFHNMINLPFLALNTSCEVLKGKIAVHEAIPASIDEQFNCQPDRFRTVTSEGMLRGLTIQYAQIFTEPVTDALRNLRLDGAPGNVDVAAADIFRSRLHGLPNYNRIRQLYGRPSIYASCTPGTTVDPLACFSQITSNVTLAQDLRTIFQKVNKIDPIVGIHAEDKPNHSSISETAAALQLTQLRALRDGDRFFWRHYLSHADKETYIRGTRMTDILSRAFPTLTDLRSNVFKVNTHATCFP